VSHALVNRTKRCNNKQYSSLQEDCYVTKITQVSHWLWPWFWPQNWSLWPCPW